MSDTVIQRLLWKEYRVQRGFWLSMAGLAVAAQMIVMLVPGRYLSAVHWLFGLALGVPAFYALGCGATLFAAEREDGTLEQLRVLAAPAWKVWWSKLSYAVVSTVGLIVLLCFAAFILAPRPMRPVELTDIQALWATWGVAAVEFLGWGIFFSLLTRRPLNAACMAAVASLGSLLVVGWLGASSRPLAPGRYDDMPLVAIWIVQVLGLFALDAWIALRRVLDRPARRQIVAPESEAQAAVRLHTHRAATASVAAFVAIMFLPVLWHSQFPSAWLLGLSVVSLAEAVAWGTLVSLRTRSPIAAAVLASVIGFLACHVVTIASAVTMYRGLPMRYVELLLGAASLRMGVALIVLVVDVWLALRWRASLGSVDVAAADVEIELTKPGSPLRRLVWQERRQAWKTIAVFWGVALAVLLFYRVSDPLRDDVSFSFAIAVAGIFSTLMGSCTFLAEQEGQRFRYFADRGIGARRVWFAKQLIWLPAALATAVAFCWISYISLRQPPRGFFTSEELLGTALLPLITYGCGQFTSMLITRGLVAGLTGLVLAFFAFLWQTLMQHLNVGLWWSVLPIPLLLLAATWLRAPDWLLERRDWRAWLRLIALLLILFPGLPAAVAAYRVFEIPASAPLIDPWEALPAVTPHEAQTATMYRDAIARLRFPEVVDRKADGSLDVGNWAENGWEHATTADRDFLDANREVIEMTLKATDRPTCVFYDPNKLRFDASLIEVTHLVTLGQLLLLEARRLEFEGELDEALKMYMATLRLAQHLAARAGATQFSYAQVVENLATTRMPRWAAHADQTPDRIRDALHRIEELFRFAPPLADAIKLEYLMIRRAMESDFEALAADTGQDDEVAVALFMRRLMPTEHARSFRLLDYRTAETLRYVADVEASLSRGNAPKPWQARAQAGYDENTQVDEWSRTTVLPIQTRAGYWAHWPLMAETRRRVLRLVLALKGWQAEHGELPATLESLVGDYFDRLPLDPWSAAPFGYSPTGFAEPVRFESPPNFVSQPGQALLWSPSNPNAPNMRIVRKGTAPDGRPIFEVTSRLGDVLWAGSVTAYPIP